MDKTKNYCIDLFYQLQRNYDIFSLEVMMDKCNNIDELFILTFQTRNCRGGKGERLLFYMMLLKLYRIRPNTVINLLKLIPHYGYYKDYINLIEIITKKYPTYINYKILKQEILQIIVNQIKRDYMELQQSYQENRKPNISLMGKYAPRPNKYNKLIAKDIYHLMFPFDNKAEEKNRKILSQLNLAVKVT
jgi:hypothetical protein